MGVNRGAPAGDPVQDNLERVPALFAGVRDRLADVEESMYRILQSDSDLLTDVATHLLAGGGKRFRPALTLLAANAFDDIDAEAVEVAAAVEVIHMATLVHDDVVDTALIRRGIPTVNSHWDDRVSILTGDYLFARAFSTLAEQDNPQVVRIMADVVSHMSVGEIRQLDRESRIEEALEQPPEALREHYFDRIYRKTAYFIGESCRLGAVVNRAPEAEAAALARYGAAIGMSYQIVDDVLDFRADSQSLGKPIGADLRTGVITLPMIEGLARSAEAKRLRSWIGREGLGRDTVTEARDLLDDCRAFDEAMSVAREYRDEAIEACQVVGETALRRQLERIAAFVVDRDF